MRPMRRILSTLIALAALLAAVPAMCAAGVDRLKPFLEYLKQDPSLDTEHAAKDPREQFIVYAKSGERARQVLDVAVKRRQQAQQFFGTSVIWKEPAVILVYPNRRAYLESGGHPFSAGEQMQGRYRGRGVKIKLVMTYEGEDVLDSILPHELMHLLITDMTNGNYFEGRRAELAPVPMWVHEGMAEYMTADADKRELYERLVYWAFYEGEQIDLDEMLPLMDYHRKIILHYAESYSFIAFIAATMPNGRLRLRNYLTSFNQNDRADDPMEIFRLAFQGTAPSIDALEQRWRSWVRQQYSVYYGPTVARTLPADKASDAPLDGKIWVEFDKPVSRASVTAATLALRLGGSKALGDDETNLLRGASLTWNRINTVLLIEVAGGFDAEAAYTLTFSDHVRDLQEHALTTDPFAEMRSGEWQKNKEKEKEKAKNAKADPNVAAEPKTETPKPPKAVVTVTFRTQRKETSGAQSIRH
jgi:hypothetical protein